jgi:hypothetical protein
VLFDELQNFGCGAHKSGYVPIFSKTISMAFHEGKVLNAAQKIVHSMLANDLSQLKAAYRANFLHAVHRIWGTLTPVEPSKGSCNMLRGIPMSALDRLAEGTLTLLSTVIKLRFNENP